MIDGSMSFKLKVVVHFLRILVCLLLSRPNVKFLVKNIFCFFWYATYRIVRPFTRALTECLNNREKRSTSRSRHGAGASCQTSHPGISARAIAFGRSWPLAAFRYQPSCRYVIEGENCRPLNHMRQIPLLLTAPDLPCQVSVRVRWRKY